MKMSLVDLCSKGIVATKKGDGYYKPVSGYMVMHDDTIIAYINYDALDGDWIAENAGGDDYVRTKPDKKIFDVFKKIT